MNGFGTALRAVWREGLRWGEGVLNGCSDTLRMYQGSVCVVGPAAELLDVWISLRYSRGSGDCIARSFVSNGLNCSWASQGLFHTLHRSRK